jgi:hypothetical protein
MSGCTVNGVTIVADKTKQECCDKLNLIGFVCSVWERGRSSKIDERWNNKFQRLVQYKQKQAWGLSYSENYKQDPSQCCLVATQQNIYANNKLRSDLRIRFELLGCVWMAGESLTGNEDQWEDMLPS